MNGPSARMRWQQSPLQSHGLCRQLRPAACSSGRPARQMNITCEPRPPPGRGSRRAARAGVAPAATPCLEPRTAGTPRRSLGLRLGRGRPSFTPQQPPRRPPRPFRLCRGAVRLSPLFHTSRQPAGAGWGGMQAERWARSCQKCRSSTAKPVSLVSYPGQHYACVRTRCYPVPRLASDLHQP